MEAFGLLFLFNDSPFEDVIQLCRIFLSRSKDSEQDTAALHVGCTKMTEIKDICAATDKRQRKSEGGVGERGRERESQTRWRWWCNTVRSSGQSATKAPEEKSPLSSSSLLSSERSLSPPHAWPPTHRRARVHLRHARRVPLSARHPSPSPDRADHPLFRSFSLSHDNQAVSSIRINAPPTAAKLLAAHIHAYKHTHTYTWTLMHVLIHPIRGSSGDGVVCIDRREVGDGTRDTSLGRGREGQMKVGVRSPLVPPGPSLLRGTLSFLSTSSIRAFPLFPRDSLWPASLSFAPYVPFRLLQLILRFLA